MADLDALRRQHTWLLRLWIERPAPALHDRLVEVRTLERAVEQARWEDAAPPHRMRWW